jgi:DNA topoisomerase-1
MWYKPVPKQCPKCSASFLVKKWNKAGEVFHVCLNKGCDYKEEVKKEETASEA